MSFWHVTTQNTARVIISSDVFSELMAAMLVKREDDCCRPDPRELLEDECRQQGLH
jgi:hypothetical protein